MLFAICGLRLPSGETNYILSISERCAYISLRLFYTLCVNRSEISMYIRICDNPKIFIKEIYLTKYFISSQGTEKISTIIASYIYIFS